MSKRVRLTSAEHRDWRQNLPQLVDIQGRPIQLVSPELEKECFKIRQLVEKGGKSLKKKVRFQEPSNERASKEGVESQKRELLIEGRVRRHGPGPDEFTIYVFVEGMLKTSAREVMTAQMFNRYGECQLSRPNGVFLKAVRDPKRPTISVSADGATRQSPAPELCQCKGWGDEHPGKHHAMCEYNVLAPQGERSDPISNASAGNPDNVERLPPGVAKVEPPKPAPKAPHPKDCQCAEWAKDDPNVHHPLCEHKRAWETQAENRPRFNLVSLDSGEIVREAEQDEIAKAQIEAKRGGQMLININDAMYLVTPLDEEAPAEDEEPEPQTEDAPMTMVMQGVDETEEADEEIEDVVREAPEPPGDDAPLTIAGLDVEA